MQSVKAFSLKRLRFVVKISDRCWCSSPTTSRRAGNYGRILCGWCYQQPSEGALTKLETLTIFKM